MSDRTEQFQQHRPVLQGIAYRMLGSRADGSRILSVFVVLNPDKLARLGNEALPDSSKQA